MRDTFIFYRSFKESMKDLSDGDKLIMYEAISDYSLDMTEPELTGFPKALFALIRPILDANIRRWRNGCKGGAPVGNKNNRYSQSTTKVQPTNNQSTTEVQANKDKEYNIRNINKDDNVLSKESKADKSAHKTTRFVKPTLEQVQSYISEKGYSIDANRFVDYYESVGWKVGRNGMKDWRAALRTWQRNNRNQPRNSEIGVVLHDDSSDKYKKEINKLW